MTAVALLAVAAATGATAQTSGTVRAGGQAWLPYPFYGYVGGAIGRADYEQDSCLFFCDDRSTGFELFAGGQVHQWFGVGVACVNLGELDRNGGDVRAQGLNLNLVGTVPISDQF